MHLKVDVRHLLFCGFLGNFSNHMHVSLLKSVFKQPCPRGSHFISALDAGVLWGRWQGWQQSVDSNKWKYWLEKAHTSLSSAFHWRVQWLLEKQGRQLKQPLRKKRLLRGAGLDNQKAKEGQQLFPSLWEIMKSTVTTASWLQRAKHQKWFYKVTTKKNLVEHKGKTDTTRLQ